MASPFPFELVQDRQREALLVECRARKVEPTGRTRVEKVLVAARGKWERTFCARTIGRLGEAGAARPLGLVAEGNEAGTALLATLKRDPGAVGLDSLLTEITKPNDVRKLGLPDALFADYPEKLVAAWRARAIKMYPSDFRDTSEDVRITLLAALCWSRQAEITDALVDLLIALVHKINACAERRVEKQLTAELKKYADVDGKTRFYDTVDAAPMDGVVRKDWREAVVDDKGKVERIPYELCVLVALRDAVRRCEIYVEGAARWRNLEDDLPGDFEAARTVHYAAIRQPMDPQAFIADLKTRMTAGLDGLSAALADGSAGG